MDSQLKRDALVSLRELYYNPSSVKKEDIKSVIDRLTASLNYEQITAVHKDDLRNLGFLPTDQDDLSRLASKMSDDYCEQLFHTSLQIIAESLGFYHSDQALETLVNVCDDVMANELSDRQRSMLRASKDVLYKAHQQDFREWDAEAVLTALNVLHEELAVYNDATILEEYGSLINRVKELIEWAN